MKIPMILCTILSVNQALYFSDFANEIEWNDFKARYSKKYSSLDEEKKRMKIFLENRQKIVDHNKKFENEETTYRMGFNEYGDMSHNEFLRAMVFGQSDDDEEEEYIEQVPKGLWIVPGVYTPMGLHLPLEVDWRKNGIITPVRKQGICGSCWAFCATAAIESHYLKHGRNVSILSPQNLVDCALEYGAAGCGGGSRNTAFTYIIDNGGINTEESYPYEAQDGTCRYNAHNNGATLTGFVYIQQSDIHVLKEVLAYIGPVGVAIDASMENFQFYSSGVFYQHCFENLTASNHDLLMIGYGREKNSDYWILKNSWGTTWGEDGFFKISSSEDGCGHPEYASYPIISKASGRRICLQLILIMNLFLVIAILK